MISSVSTFDAPRAYEVAQRLPAITIPDDVDVDALEMGKYKRCVVGVLVEFVTTWRIGFVRSYTSFFWNN